jgi:hypothetical protein
LTSIARVHGINAMMDNRQAKKANDHNITTPPTNDLPKQEEKTKQAKKPEKPQEKIYDIE